MTLKLHKLAYDKRCDCPVPFRHRGKIARNERLKAYYGTQWPRCPICQELFVARIVDDADHENPIPPQT